jgi:ABC-type multidrug transport system ATPase subunit
MNEQQPYIRVENLTYCYEDGTKALDGINLEIGLGEMIAFIGQNGSGKTTFLQMP